MGFKAKVDPPLPCIMIQLTGPKQGFYIQVAFLGVDAIDGKLPSAELFHDILWKKGSSESSW